MSSSKPDANPAPRISSNRKYQTHAAIIWDEIDRLERNMPGTLDRYMNDKDKRKAPDYGLVLDATLDPTTWHYVDTFRRAGYVKPEQYADVRGWKLYLHRVGCVARVYYRELITGRLTTSPQE